LNSQQYQKDYSKRPQLCNCKIFLNITTAARLNTEIIASSFIYLGLLTVRYSARSDNQILTVPVYSGWIFRLLAVLTD